MKRLVFLIISVYCFVGGTTIAQIGIGTTQPQEYLHVVGTLRVEGTDDMNDTTALIGANDDGTLTSLNIDSSLSIINNTLEVTASYLYDIGSFDMSTITIISGQAADLDINIGPGEENEGKTVIYLNNLASNIKLTGFQDGVDGLHLFLLNKASTRNIQFLDENTLGNNSTLINRIKVLSNNETISGYGCIEILYDGDSERWLILSIHD